MAADSVNRVVEGARRAALRQEAAGRTDGELLEAFARRRDADAFEALVRRHGAMVLGVCRRVLGNAADADDAFQATFLVLLRKAGSIRKAAAVSNWLYGVAHTTALKAKAMYRKRRLRERQAAECQAAERSAALTRHEAREEVWLALQALLDLELAALPDKYRTPIVLCELEGKTIREATAQLGWPQGTVATRLTRGRALLARRLARHGLTVSAGALSAALAHGIACAALPPSLVSATVQAGSLIAAGQGAVGVVSAKVVTLSQGVMQAMLLTKLKSCVLGLMAVAVVGVGVASLVPGRAGGGLLAPASAQEPAPQVKPLPPADGAALLQAEIDRLRAELKKTRLELERARYEITVLRAQAALAEADAQLARLKKDDADAKAAPLAAVQDLLIVKGAAGQVTAASPDGRTVAAVEGKVIVLIEAESGRVLYKALGHKEAVAAVAFSPDGKLLVSGGKDKAVRMWDAATGKELRALLVPGVVSGVAFSPDARTLVIIETDLTRREFDAATGKVLRVVPAPKGTRP